MYDSTDILPAEIQLDEDSIVRISDQLLHNGLNLTSQIRKSLKTRRLSHKFLLNKLKLLFMNCVMSALEANEDCFRRIKNIVSVEILKVNLIWVYRDFVQ